MIGAVKLNPEITGAEGVADFLSGLAGNPEVLEKNYPFVPADFRNAPVCSLCLGAGLLPAKFAIYTPDAVQKVICYVNTKVPCSKCQGRGEALLVKARAQ